MWKTNPCAGVSRDGLFTSRVNGKGPVKPCPVSPDLLAIPGKASPLMRTRTWLMNFWLASKRVWLGYSLVAWCLSHV